MDNQNQPQDFADLQPSQIEECFSLAAPPPNTLQASAFEWLDPETIPVRPWLVSGWLLRGEVTVIIAPGGTGKSALGNGLALSVATGRALLGKDVIRGPAGAWIYNLEDDAVELSRQVMGSCLHHGITQDEVGNRLYVNSGITQPLCMATGDQGSFELNHSGFEQLKTTIITNQIGLVIVDPFVSSHQANENDNGAIDTLTKAWKKLAIETDCAIALVHHTKKTGGNAVTAEDGRGASALHATARVVLTLNKILPDEAMKLGAGELDATSLVRVALGKANRSRVSDACLIRLASIDLGNGGNGSPSDEIGAAEIWERPAVQELTPEQIQCVQDAVSLADYRKSAQSPEWVGVAIASTLGLDPVCDRRRVLQLQDALESRGYLKYQTRKDGGKDRPFCIVGKLIEVDSKPITQHLNSIGAAGGEVDNTTSGVTP